MPPAEDLSAAQQMTWKVRRSRARRREQTCRSELSVLFAYRPPRYRVLFASCNQTYDDVRRPRPAHRRPPAPDDRWQGDHKFDIAEIDKADTFIGITWRFGCQRCIRTSVSRVDLTSHRIARNDLRCLLARLSRVPKPDLLGFPPPTRAKLTCRPSRKFFTGSTLKVVTINTIT